MKLNVPIEAMQTEGGRRLHQALTQFNPNKINVRVFPDYCSSGLWENAVPPGANMDTDDFKGVVPEGLMLALKYWHEVWEWVIAEYTSDCGRQASNSYVHRWNEDGKRIVELMNEAQDKYNFIYVETEL